MSSFEPTIVAFLCNWCSYAGADLAGTGRLKYHPNVKVIRVMCSGRVNPLYVLKAFKEGADGVLVSGCHPGDCHYIKGNMFARRRFAVLKNILEYIGIEPHMSWVSASEGAKFAQVINEVTESVRALGPQKKLTKVCMHE
jgi:F420-non-reducing hydrogenase iron-sulfur subunit